jgi:hypothetical protein
LAPAATGEKHCIDPAVAAAMLALLAVSQAIGGTLLGDWLHVTVNVSPVSTTALELQDVIASTPLGGGRWEALEDVRSRLLANNDMNDDGAIAAGGAQVTTEFGLWSVCVWVRIAPEASGADMREAVQCKSYGSIASNGSILILNDDDYGQINAPQVSSISFGSAGGLAIASCVLGSLALVCTVAVTCSIASRPPRRRVAMSIDDDLDEDGGGCCGCGNSSEPFPTTGWPAMLVVVAAVSLVLSVIATSATLGSILASPLAKELSTFRVSQPSTQTIFSVGTSVTMAALSISFFLLHLAAFIVGYVWYRTPPGGLVDNDEEDDVLMKEGGYAEMIGAGAPYGHQHSANGEYDSDEDGKPY